MYTCQWTHIVCNPPPPSANKCVTCARSVRVCACVCAHCARAPANYARGRARAVRAHCTRGLYLLTVRARCRRTVRADCTQKVCAKICRFFQNLLPFVENLLRFFKICCDFLHVQSKRAAAVQYGARARVRCVRGRARANCTRGARALYVRTARADCTYRTRSVRPDCTQKVCAKICCVLFKICCVFSKSVVFFSKSALFFCTYGPRVRWPYGTARARAVYVRATRARCTYRMREPYSRTVRKKCVPNFILLFFSKCDVFFSKSVAFFSILRCSFRTYGPRIWWSYGMARARAVRTYVRRARARVYGVQRTRAVYVCGARSARVWRA